MPAANLGSRKAQEVVHVLRFIQKIAIPLIVMFGLVFSSAGAVMAQEPEKPTVVVGSKNYTEQIILSEFVSVLLEDAGYPVERQYDLGGTGIAFQALQNDEIDIYVEWTGSALSAVLEADVPEGKSQKEISDKTYKLVSREYQEQFGIAWLERWGYNNTYAFAVTQETAEEYDLQTISDLKDVAGELTLGTDQEFPVRQDGLPGVQEVYGIEFGDVQPGDPGLMYSAIDNGDVDVITAYTTDGRLPQLDLVLLEDDKNFFPPYNPAPIMKQEMLDKYPEIADVINQLSGKISETEMQDLNYQVDKEGKEPNEVVTAFLVDQGIIDESG